VGIDLDHFLILTEPAAPQAELLTNIGLVEGTSNTHPGQGTANRRFFFSNAMLELAYIREDYTSESERTMPAHHRLPSSSGEPLTRATIRFRAGATILNISVAISIFMSAKTRMYWKNRYAYACRSCRLPRQVSPHRWSPSQRSLNCA
jgi:hypothetical protein